MDMVSYTFQDIRSLVAINKDLLLVLDATQWEQQLYIVNLSDAFSTCPQQGRQAVKLLAAGSRPQQTTQPRVPPGITTPAPDGRTDAAAAAAGGGGPLDLPVQDPRCCCYDPSADVLYVLDGAGELYRLHGVLGCLHHGVEHVAAAPTLSHHQQWSCLGLKQELAIPSNSQLAMALEDTGKGTRLLISCSSRHVVLEVQLTKSPTASVYVGRDGVAGCSDGDRRQAALLHKCKALAVGSAGQLFVADSGNGRLRCVDTQGRVSTMRCQEVAAEQRLPEPASLGGTTAMAIDGDDNLYVSGRWRDLIRISPDCETHTLLQDLGHPVSALEVCGNGYLAVASPNSIKLWTAEALGVPPVTPAAAAPAAPGATLQAQAAAAPGTAQQPATPQVGSMAGCMEAGEGFQQQQQTLLRPRCGLLFPRVALDLTQRGLAADMLELLESGAGADLLLQASDGSSAAAHCCVLMSRSRYFLTMGQQPDWTENRTGVVQVPGISRAALEVLLRYMYSGNLPPDLQEPVLQELLNTADLWAMEDLLYRCSQAVRQLLQPDNAVHWLLWADQRHMCCQLSHAVQAYMVCSWAQVLEVEGALEELMDQGRRELVADLVRRAFKGGVGCRGSG